VPNAALRPCLRPGCARLVQSGYCPDHSGHIAIKRAGYDNEHRDDAARKLYRSGRWKKYSLWRLRGNPFCVKCGRPAQATDHIIPAYVAPERFFDPTNHQSLCHRCNIQKGRR
jgi:5-methylcytosine-specific restriction protein A